MSYKSALENIYPPYIKVYIGKKVSTFEPVNLSIPGRGRCSNGPGPDTIFC